MAEEFKVERLVDLLRDEKSYHAGWVRGLAAGMRVAIEYAAECRKSEDNEALPDEMREEAAWAATAAADIAERLGRVEYPIE